MKRSLEIRNELQNIINRVESLEQAADGRDYSESERSEIDALFERRQVLNKDLDRALQVEATNETAVFAKLDEKLNGGKPRAKQTVYYLAGKQSAIKAMGSSGIENGIGEFVKAAICGPSRNTHHVIKNSMSTASNPAGGFLVPEELWPETIDLMRARSVLVEAGMRTVVMTTGDMSVAGVDGDPVYNVFGENQTITPSSIQFKSTRLSPLKVGTIIRASRELAEDAPNFGELVATVLENSMGAQLDRYGIRGGAGFTGLELHPDITQTDGVGAIKWLDIATAATAIREANGEPGAAIMAPAIRDSLLQSQDLQNQWLGNPPSLENVNMLHTTNCSSSFVIVGDFSNLIMGVRTRPLVEVSTDASDAFQTHSVLVKITARIDFAVVRPNQFHRLAGVTE